MQHVSLLFIAIFWLMVVVAAEAGNHAFNEIHGPAGDRPCGSLICYALNPR